MNTQLRKGFTLIELLIVIVIIGVLAGTLIAAVNPVEQVRKATDTGKKNIASDLVNAAGRYYASFQAWPYAAAVPANNTAITSADAWIATGLVGNNEITSAASGKINTSTLFFFTNADGSPRVCFDPASKAFDAQAFWVPATGVKGVAAATNYVCVPEF